MKRILLDLVVYGRTHCIQLTKRRRCRHNGRPGIIGVDASATHAHYCGPMARSRRAADAQRRSMARRQADKERRQEQWAQAQTRKLALVDTAYAAANDYMLERYERAMVDDRWVSPRGQNETHASYYQRLGKHQAQIEQLAKPLRERAANGHTLRPSLDAHARRGTRPAYPRSSPRDDSTNSSGSDSDSDSTRGGRSESAAGAGSVAKDNGQVLTKTLQQAAADGDKEMVRLLLASGLDPDEKDGDVSNETALHVAFGASGHRGNAAPGRGPRR